MASGSQDKAIRPQEVWKLWLVYFHAIGFTLQRKRMTMTSASLMLGLEEQQGERVGGGWEGTCGELFVDQI